ncbi:MAG: [FeFe] hydrogenase H-cluster radical SAM maturase HydE, partial [Clostridia bacterium]|nr:[FeFe] hydrogenase H-cluster radical SAM maturase HydE [Clostridia bacterium]
KDGADRYLLKHETANEALYDTYHPHSNFRRRLECLHQLKELGYQTGSGFMIGLPQQTIESLAQDILLLHELDVDMAGIGVFIPHPKTPLKDGTSGDNLLAMKCVAISRILLKRTHLPITTSIKVNNNETSFNPFMAGANVVMTKLEPYEYQKLYEIYPNKTVKDIPMKQARLELERSIESFGKAVSDTKGDAVTEFKL